MKKCDFCKYLDIDGKCRGEVPYDCHEALNTFKEITLEIERNRNTRTYNRNENKNYNYKK